MKTIEICYVKTANVTEQFSVADDCDLAALRAALEQGDGSVDVTEGLLHSGPTD